MISKEMSRCCTSDFWTFTFTMDMVKMADILCEKKYSKWAVL
jgi:hypothetical protein